MKLDSKNTRKILLIIFLSAIIFALIFNFMGFLAFLAKLMTYVTPIIVALCIAFVLNVFLTGFETKIFKFMGKAKHKLVRKLRRPLCLILTYLLAFGVVALVVLVIIPDIKDTVAYIIDKLPGFIVESREWLVTTLEGFDIPTDEIPEIDVNTFMDTVKNLISRYSTTIVDDAISITGSVLGVVSNILFGVIVSIYVLAQKEKIGAFMKRMIDSFLPQSGAYIVHHVCQQTYTSFTKFIGGQLTEAIFLGVLCYIGMLIFRFPNAAIISVIICITALVPIIGAWIGALVGALLILITDPLKAILFLLFLIILQQLEGNLIYPKVVGKAVGLPGVIVISAVLVGNNVGGVLGALVSVPLSAVIYTLLKEAMDYIGNKRKKEKELQLSTENTEIAESN